MSVLTPRQQLTRFNDQKRKKELRKQTKDLLQQLWGLETSARRGEAGPHPPRSKSITVHAVIEEVTLRLRRILAEGRGQPGEQGAAQEAAGGGSGAHAPDPGEGEASAGPGGLDGLVLPDLVAGLQAAVSLGVMYVCVDDWVVRRSNRAMELACSFDLMRGCVGFELPPLVHPDDHLQLRMLKEEQVQAYKPGDLLVLSVRLLRVCQDGGTLVCGWRRQILEVAHVARDEQYGGKLHVLFTCVLERDSLEPLTFDAADRTLFQAAAEVISGTMATDPQRTSESLETVTERMSGMGLQDHAPRPGQPAQETPVADSRAEWRVGEMINGMTGQIMKYFQSCAASTFNGFVRTHVALGLNPEGTPWIHKAASVSAFGMSSRWSVYNTLGMSGRPSSYIGTGKQFQAVNRPYRSDDGEIVVGYMGFSAANPPGGGWGLGPLVCVYETIFYVDPLAQTCRERTWVCFLKERGALPQKIDCIYHKVAPPVPELMQLFRTFAEPERLVDPFSQLLKRG